MSLGGRTGDAGTCAGSGDLFAMLSLVTVPGLSVRGAVVMKAWLIACALVANSMLAACSAETASPGQDPPSSSRSGSTSPSPTPDTPAEEHRAFPFTFVDLNRLPTTHVTSEPPSGAPPRVLWTEPRGFRQVAYRGLEVIRAPVGLSIAMPFGDGYLATGGCTRSAERCGDRVRGALHVLAADGSVTTLEPAAKRTEVVNVMVSFDATEVAWTWDGPSTYVVSRFAIGDSAPTRVPDPESAHDWKFPRVAGILGPGDLVISLHDADGDAVDFVRTSGEQSGWEARSLEVIAPGLLLGDPAFTKRRDACFALYTADESAPRWTRCYRDGKRPADGPYGVAMSLDGRWMVGTHFGDVVLIDGRTGIGKRRLHFDDRVEAVTFEDKDHFLVVLDRPLYPGPDSRPGVNWIVRCRVDLDCERATPNIEIDDYATLDFVPSQR